MRKHTSSVRAFSLFVISLLYIPRYGRGVEKELRRKSFYWAKRVVRKARGIISRLSLLPGRVREQFALGLIEFGNLVTRLGLNLIPEAHQVEQGAEEHVSEDLLDEWLAWEAANGVSGVPSAATQLDRYAERDRFEREWDAAVATMTTDEVQEWLEWDAALLSTTQNPVEERFGEQAKVTPVMVCSVEDGLAVMGGEKTVEQVEWQPLADVIADKDSPKAKARKPRARKARSVAHASSPNKSAVPPSKKKLAAMTPEELVQLGRALGIKRLSARMRKDTLLWRITTHKAG